MKTSKMLLVVAMLLSSHAFAQNTLKLENGYEVSYTPNESYQVRDANMMVSVQDYNTGDYNKFRMQSVGTMGDVKWRYQLRLKYNQFALFSNTSIYMNSTKRVSFAPSTAIFDIDLRYTINKFCLSVGHRCVHSIRNHDNVGDISGGYAIKVCLKYNIE